MVDRTSRVSPIRSIPAQPPRVDQKRYSFDDHASTISKSKTITPPFVTSKPVLDSPPIWSVLNGVGRLEEAAYHFTLQKEKQIESIFDRIKALQMEESKKLEEAFAASEDLSFWGILSDVGNTLTSSVSFFFGFAAISSGGTAVGAALITSGVLSLTNIAFKHAEAWDWIADQVAGEDQETKQMIKTYLPVAIGLLAAATGVYGSYAAWNYPQLQGTAKTMAILQTTVSVAQGITAWGNGRANQLYKTAEAEASALQTKTELTTLDVEVVVDEIKRFQKELAEIQEHIGRLVQDTCHAIQVTQQTV